MISNKNDKIVPLSSACVEDIIKNEKLADFYIYPVVNGDEEIQLYFDKHGDGQNKFLGSFHLNNGTSFIKIKDYEKLKSIYKFEVDNLLNKINEYNSNPELEEIENKK